MKGDSRWSGVGALWDDLPWFVSGDCHGLVMLCGIQDRRLLESAFHR